MSSISETNSHNTRNRLTEYYDCDGDDGNDNGGGDEGEGDKCGREKKVYLRQTAINRKLPEIVLWSYYSDDVHGDYYAGDGHGYDVDDDGGDYNGDDEILIEIMMLRSKEHITGGDDYIWDRYRLHIIVHMIKYSMIKYSKRNLRCI